MGELRSREIEDMQLLLHYASFMGTIFDDERMKKRAEECGAYQDLIGAGELIGEAINKLHTTMEDKTFRKCLACAAMKLMSLRPNNSATDPDGRYIIVPKKSYEIALAFAGMNNCIGCYKDVHEVHNCEFREALKDCAIIDWDLLEPGGLCAGMEIGWSDMMEMARR